MSDRPASAATLAQRSDDIRAVMDAAGSRRAALHASYEGCRLAVAFAAAHPERVEGLVLVDPSARGTRSDDYPWAPGEEEWERMIDEVEREWGSDAYVEQQVRAANPTASRDPEILRWFVRHLRRSASPGTAVQFQRMLRDGDATPLLGAVRAPTLVLHQPRHAETSRYVAERIDGARLVELPAEDGVYWLDDDCVDRWVDETLAFLDRLDAAPETERALVAVVAAEPVESPAALADVVAAHRGRVVHEEAGLVVAAFASAAPATAAAHELVRGPAARCSVHVGESEIVAGRPVGGAVETVRRLLDDAALGQVLTSAVVDAILAGSPSAA